MAVMESGDIGQGSAIADDKFRLTNILFRLTNIPFRLTNILASQHAFFSILANRSAI